MTSGPIAPGLQIWDAAETLFDNLIYSQGTSSEAIPATFVVDRGGSIGARFVDPDYRKRVAIDDLVAALRSAK